MNKKHIDLVRLNKSEKMSNVQVFVLRQKMEKNPML